MKAKRFFVVTVSGLVIGASALIGSGAFSESFAKLPSQVSKEISAERKSSIGAAGAMAFVVNYVAPGSPAEAAGLKEGDVITEINGGQIDTISDFQEKITQAEPGTTFNISYMRYDTDKGVLGQRKTIVKSAKPGDVYK